MPEVPLVYNGIPVRVQVALPATDSVAISEKADIRILMLFSGNGRCSAVLYNHKGVALFHYTPNHGNPGDFSIFRNTINNGIRDYVDYEIEDSDISTMRFFFNE